MTPNDKKILQCLVAVAWADGKVEKLEEGVIDGILDGFGAEATEAEEIRAYAKTKRTLKDVPLGDLDEEDREVLLGNAAVLTHADGEQSELEKQVLDDLVKAIGLPPEKSKTIIAEAKDGALHLGTRGLVDA